MANSYCKSIWGRRILACDLSNLPIENHFLAALAHFFIGCRTNFTASISIFLNHPKRWMVANLLTLVQSVPLILIALLILRISLFSVILVIKKINWPRFEFDELETDNYDCYCLAGYLGNNVFDRNSIRKWLYSSDQKLARTKKHKLKF